ncbi:MAG: 1-deoxy-D-xylulose-5-phosphate reductoisomerase [Saccharospirillum sp.]|nr:1-deoxy-D-xylulose-5-phosphate reductoisomerase [Saccharospirillum sp.]
MITQHEARSVAILGSTGSIGTNTLDVISRHPERFNVFAISGYRNISLLASQARQHRPRFIVVPDADSERRLVSELDGLAVEVLVGEQALVEIAEHPEVDVVMAAIVGSAGLRSSIAAAGAGKRLLLANKESLVVAGHLLMDAARAAGAVLLPIDSEHNAIFQCLPATLPHQGVQSVLLTASGGPLRSLSLSELEAVTPAQAIAHPNWSMGQKISVDSASLMNKGLELIEACWLFDLKPSDIEVVIHPQSVIHSMVRYRDGSVLAQMGAPDMRTPIAYGLAWPERIDSGSAHLAFDQSLQLTFDKPDRVRFPCLRLAEEAMAQGGTMPAVLNATNEVSVQSFLNACIGFTDIAHINERIMERMGSEAVESVEQLMEIDQQARALAVQAIAEQG